MSSNNPPIIRSNSPFKVEVTPGSLNAGGKKNGVLPGQASGQQRDMAFDFNNDAPSDESFLALPETPSPDQVVSEGTTPQANNSLSADAASPANLIQLDESLPSLTPPVGFVPSDAQDPNNLRLGADSSLDNTLKLEAEASGSNRNKLPKDEAGTKNSIDIPVEHSVQAVVKLIMEHPDTPEQVKILIKQNRSNPVVLEDPKARDNVAKLELDRPQDNKQVLIPDAPDAPNRLSIDQDTALSPTSKFDDPLKAPHQAHFTPDLQSEHREAIDEAAASNHLQILPEDSSGAQEKTSVLALHAPLTEQVLASVALSAQALQPRQDDSPLSPQLAEPALLATPEPQAVIETPVVSAKRAQMLEIRNAHMEEKQRKSEDFSGRVNAIRKSVAHVNQRLDVVEKTPRVVVE